jgi:phosphonate transport system substrate-binding protein
MMSGGHDKSALGVVSGAYDMAGVASDVFERMLARGTLKADDFRIIFTSPIFPTSSFAYAHDLRPDLARKIRACFFAFDFPPSMRKSSTARPLFSDNLQGCLEGGARDRECVRHSLQQGNL